MSSSDDEDSNSTKITKEAASVLGLENIIHGKMLELMDENNELAEKFEKVMEDEQEEIEKGELLCEYHRHGRRAWELIDFQRKKDQLFRELVNSFEKKEEKMIEMVVSYCSKVNLSLSQLLDSKLDPKAKKEKWFTRSQLDGILDEYLEKMEEEHRKIKRIERGNEKNKEELASMHEDLVRGLKMLVELVPSDMDISGKKETKRESHKSVDSVPPEKHLIPLNNQNVLNALYLASPGFSKIKEGLDEVATLVKQNEFASLLSGSGRSSGTQNESDKRPDESKEVTPFNIVDSPSKKQERDEPKQERKLGILIQKRLKSYLIQLNNDWRMAITQKAVEKFIEIPGTIKDPKEQMKLKMEISSFCSALAYSESCLVLSKAHQIEKDAEVLLKKSLDPFFKKVRDHLAEIKRELGYLLNSLPLSTAICLESYSNKKNKSNELGQQLKTIIAEYADKINKEIEWKGQEDQGNTREIEKTIKELSRIFKKAKKNQGISSIFNKKRDWEADKFILDIGQAILAQV